MQLGVIGNLGADPELRYTQDGSPLCRFNVAASFGVRRPDGEWENKTEWVQVTIFGKRAETLPGILSKGMRVYVSGRLQVRPWTDRSNEPRAGLQLAADTVEVMSSPRQRDDSDDDLTEAERSGVDDDDLTRGLPF